LTTWVLFDVGETLLHPAPDFASAFTRVCAEQGVECDPSVVVSAAADLWSTRPGASGTGYSLSAASSRAFWTGQYSALLRRLGVGEARVSPTVDALYEHFSSPSSYELFPDARPCLERCVSAGLRLGIVSNFEAWLMDLLARMEIVNLFEIAVVSGVEGVEKPDPAIFERALERTMSPPEEVGHVGDSLLEDVRVAEDIGMRAVLLDRSDRHAAYHGCRIRSLDEVPGCFLGVVPGAPVSRWSRARPHDPL
jgi:putative hydrolase of the HAD superfamily